jgi:hypothetical protein
MILTASIPPIINVGPSGGGNWLQRDYEYGVNDSGAFQSLVTQGKIADVEADAVNFFLAGWTVKIKYDIGGFGTNGIATMTASAGWTGTGTGGLNYVSEVLNSSWELDPEESDKGMLEANFPFTGTATGFNSIALTSGIESTNAPNINGGTTSSSVTRLAIQAAVDDSSPVWSPPGSQNPGSPGGLNLSSGAFYVFDSGLQPSSFYSGGTIPLPIADYAAAYSLFKLISAGNTQFPIDAPRIKKTQLFSNLYDTQFTYSNVGRIIGDNSMYQQEGVPQDILFSVAATSQTTGTVNQFIETPGDLQYGWKKSYPEITKLALYKWRVTQYYQLGLWPVRSFGMVL